MQSASPLRPSTYHRSSEILMRWKKRKRAQPESLGTFILKEDRTPEETELRRRAVETALRAFGINPRATGVVGPIGDEVILLLRRGGDWSELRAYLEKFCSNRRSNSGDSLDTLTTAISNAFGGDQE